MNKISLILLFLLIPFTTFAEDVKLYITGNITTYDFNECKDVSKNLSLTEKGEVIAKAVSTFDSFSESTNKQIGRFSFYIPIKKELIFSDYDIVSSEDVYNLGNYRQRTRIVKGNTILIPDIILFCNKKELNNLVEESYKEDIQKGITGPIGSTVEGKLPDVLFQKLSITSNLDGEKINIEVTDTNGEIIFERKDLELPFSTENKEILESFITRQYKVTSTLKGYGKVIKTINIDGKEILINLEFLKKETGLEFDPSKSHGEVDGVNSQTKEDGKIEDSTSIVKSDTSNDQINTTGDNSKILSKIILEGKTSGIYEILINGTLIEEGKEYSLDNKKTIEVFKDQRLIKSIENTGSGEIFIDVRESSILIYILGVSLGVLLILVLVILKKRSIVKSKKNT